MGAYVASHALQERRVEARLLIAFGAIPDAPVETLLLEGGWEELLTPPKGAVVSPWSDHCLEPWDPVLVSAAVSAATQKVGLTPAPVSRWKLRVLGAALVLLGAVLLIFALTPDRGGALTGAGVAAIALAWPALGLPLWFAGAPTRGHVPLQVLFSLSIGAGSLVLEKLTKKPARVTLGAVAALALLGAAAALLGGNAFGALVGTIFTGLVALGWGLAAFAEARTKSPAAAHAAFGLFLGYLLGQWFPLPF
jgi:hypothetical protein